jgi:NADH-quinone oxidoreductase subunit K
MLMAVEIMLASASLDLVAFDAWLRDRIHSGQILTLFVVVIAAAEVGIGFAIVLNVFRLRETVAVDALTDLRETDDPAGDAAAGGDPTPAGERLGA